MRPGFRTQMIVAVVLAGLLTVPAVAQPPLLSSSAPGAFGVRYLADRAVVTYTVEKPEDSDAETFTLRVRLPEEVRWGFFDREPIPGDELGWDDGQAVVDVPFGSARMHLGWAGEANLPPEAAEVPLVLDDERVGSLTARFDLEGMQAGGEVPAVGPGMADVKVEFTEPVRPDAASLSAGEDAVQNWRYDGPTLEAREPLQIGPNPRVSLRVQQRGLTASPVERVVFSNVRSPSPVAQIPDDEAPEGTLVEAEDYVDFTGTEPQVDPGSHYDTHGGACIYSFLGDGTTLTWEFDVPEGGQWDLYLRISCGDVGAWRAITVNGETPEGLDLVELPGTGGWGHTEGEWWIVRVTGGDDLPPALELNEGANTLTMTGLLTTHLNIDYLLLVPHE